MKPVLKALSILLPIYAIYCIFNFLWIRLIISVVSWFFVGYLGQRIDSSYSTKELSSGCDRNGSHRWDSVLDNMDYDILKNDVINYIGTIKETEEEKGAHYHVPKEVKLSLDEFLRNPCRRTAADLLDASPGMEEYFLTCKKSMNLLRK